MVAIIEGMGVCPSDQRTLPQQTYNRKQSTMDLLLAVPERRLRYNEEFE